MPSKAMIKKILVTGSSGTVGTRLCEILMKQGYEVVGVDWKKNKWNSEVDKITLQGDLRKSDVFKEIPKDIDLIIHLAANARVYNLVLEPELARDNFDTVFNVLEFARKNSISRFMFSSSREVYGNINKPVLNEGDAQIRYCESPYTASKIGGEALVHAYQQCYNINFVMFRFSNVYGMYDESDRVIPLFIRQCRAGQDLTVFGKEKKLDFTYIDDTIAGIIHAIERFDTVKNDVFNLAYGEGTSLVDIAEWIKNSLAPNLSIHIGTNRTGEVVRYIADTTKAIEKLAFQPKTPIREGIQKTIEWYKANE